MEGRRRNGTCSSPLISCSSQHRPNSNGFQTPDALGIPRTSFITSLLPHPQHQPRPGSIPLLILSYLSPSFQLLVSHNLSLFPWPLSSHSASGCNCSLQPVSMFPCYYLFGCTGSSLFMAACGIFSYGTITLSCSMWEQICVLSSLPAFYSPVQGSLPSESLWDLRPPRVNSGEGESRVKKNE